MNFFTLRFTFDLLKHFLRRDVCCHIGGAFPAYLTGLQTGFQRVSFFIALKNSPLLNLLFQRGETLRESFYLGRYHFEVYHNLQHMDACRYVVRRGGLRYAFSFLGIDSLVECGTTSNVDNHPLCLEAPRGSVRFPAPRYNASICPGRFYYPPIVYQTL